MSTELCCQPCGDSAIFPEAFVVHLQGGCCRCGEAIKSSACGSCNDSGICPDCSALNQTIVVRRATQDSLRYEYKFQGNDFYSGEVPCSLDKAELELIKHESSGKTWYSVCLALQFLAGSGKRPVTWYRSRLTDCCNVGILRRHIVGRGGCWPQFIEVQTTPTPDYCPPPPEWRRGHPDDLSDADYWPSMDIPLLQDSPEVSVRYSNGELQLRIKDLGSDGFGIPWGHTRIFSNRLSNSYDFGNGTNWLIHEWPQLVRRKTDPREVRALHPGATQTPTGCTLVMIRGTRNTIWFDEFKAENDQTEWRARFGAKQTLEFNSHTKRFRVVTAHGHKWEFYPFTRPCFTPKRPQDESHDRRLDGKLFRYVDSAGNQITPTYKEGRLERFTRSSGSKKEEFLYEYYTTGDNKGRLRFVTWKRGGPLLRAEYKYYEKNESYGSLGDLKTATTAYFVKDGSAAGTWRSRQDYVHYYRYATQPEPKQPTASNQSDKKPCDTYCQGLLRYVVSPEAYHRIKKDKKLPNGGSPETASDVLIAKYADIRIDYHEGTDPFCARRVKNISLFGGARQHTFKYRGDDFRPSLPLSRGWVSSYGRWRSTTTEIRADGSQQVVTSNFIGQTLRSDLVHGTSRWVHCLEYDKDHAGVTRHCTPSTVEDPKYSPYTSYPVFKQFVKKGVSAGKVRFCTYHAINKNRAFLASVSEFNGIEPSFDVEGPSDKKLSDEKKDEKIKQGLKDSLLKSYCYKIVNPRYAICALTSETEHGAGLDPRGKTIDGKTLFDFSFAREEQLPKVNPDYDGLVGLAKLTRRRVLLPEVPTDYFEYADSYLPKAASAHECKSFSRNKSKKTTCGDLASWDTSRPVICEEYDDYGNVVRAVDLRGTVTKYKFDVAKGVPIQKTIQSVIRKGEVVTGQSVKAIREGVQAQEFVFDYRSDDFGRITEALGPRHKATVESGKPEAVVRTATWYFYKVFSGEVWTSQGYVEGANRIYLNPVSIRKTDLAGRTTDEIVALREGKARPESNEPAIPQSKWVRWVHQRFNRRRTRVTSRTYHSIPSKDGDRGVVGVNFHRTVTSSEIKNRRKVTEISDGSIYETEFEVRGLPTEIRTSSSKSNKQGLAHVEYDGGLPGGNGNITAIRRKDGTTTRETRLSYDARDRQRTVVEADGTYMKYEYTQQNAVYKVVRRSKTNQEEIPEEDKEKTFAEQVENRDARGRVYLKQLIGFRYGLPGEELKPLVEKFLYDEANQLVAHETYGSKAVTLGRSAGPFPIGISRARPITGFSYDGMGREIARWSCIQSPTPWFTSTFSTFEQLQMSYDEAGSPLLVTSYSRFPESAIRRGRGSGRLGDAFGRDRDNLNLTPGRTTTIGYWYDPVGRKIAMSDFGVKTLNGVRPSQLDRQYPTTNWEFDGRGEVTAVFDVLNNSSRFGYDHAGRCTSAANNLTLQQFKALSQATGAPGSAFAIADDATMSQFQYTAENELFRSRASNEHTQVQESKLNYGANPDAAKPTPNAHLPQDSVDAEDRQTKLTYTSLGEISTVTDPNGTIHKYHYNHKGLLCADVIVEFGEGVDNSVKSISYGYDEFNRLVNVRTKTPLESQPANWVERKFGSYNELIVEAQHHSEGEIKDETENLEFFSGDASELSVINGDAVPGHVGYYYDYPTWTENRHALNTIWYPGDQKIGGKGRRVSFGFRDDPSRMGYSNDRILGRPSYLQENGPEGEGKTFEPEYFGLGATYRRKFTRPDVSLARGITGLPAFSSLDSYGRQWDCQWQKGGQQGVVLEHVQAPSDIAGRVRWRKSLLDNGRDDLLVHDRLDRLVAQDRGFLTLESKGFGHSVLDAKPVMKGTLKYLQRWKRDQKGNWVQWQRRKFLSGQVQDEIQQRWHSKTNHIQFFTTLRWHEPTYDPAGNMVTMPMPGEPVLQAEAKYDGWGRLTTFTDQARKTIRFRHDGLGRRIVQIADGITRHFYYDQSGRVISEMVDELKKKVRDREYVWDPNSTSRLICRIRYVGAGIERLYPLYDMSGNVTAIVDEQGQVKERYAYDPQGHVTYLDADFVERPLQKSSYAWEYLFRGMRLDRESGLYFTGQNYYHPDLGRFLPRGSTPVVPESQLNSYVQDFPFGQFRPGWLQRTAEPIFQWISEQSPWIKFGIGAALLVVTVACLIGATILNPAAAINDIGAICGALQGGIGAYISGGDFGDIMLGTGLGAAFGAVCPLGGIGSLVGSGVGILFAFGADGYNPKSLSLGWEWGGLIGGIAGGVGHWAKHAARRSLGSFVLNIGPDLLGAGGGAIYGAWQDGTSTSALRWAQIGMMGTNVGAGLARGAWGVLRAEPVGGSRLVDDPLIDNNILTWLHIQQPDAVRFGNRYKGLLSIEATVVGEFLEGRNVSDLHLLIGKYGIEIKPAVSSVFAKEIMTLRGGSVLKNDDFIVAAAKYYGIRFATGDVGALKSAILAQVDTRYFFFKPGVNQWEAYANFMRKMMQDARIMDRVTPLDIWGPTNPW